VKYPFLLAYFLLISFSFEEIDLNKDGIVDPVELAKAFSRLKIVLKKKDLMKIIEVLDRDKDFNITFSEWQTYFRFAPSTELEASLRSWRRGVQLDTINEQQMPNSYTEKERENGFYARHFIAGALSGMVSRTVTAPLDRLKIYMQAMGKKKLLNTATYEEMK
jgi:solute carrier family 25 phosphate transporter 23/24/25/41